MFISHKYKVIFVHIQKNGGTSIENLFEEFDPDLIKRIWIDPSKKTLRHSFASDIKAAIDDNIFRNYTKFCVVRNPFDRMVSWYSMFKQGTVEIEPLSQPSALKAMGENVMAEVNRNSNSFDEFLMLPENHESGLFRRFYANQIDYIWEKKGILADRVLRFENLAGDFKKLAKEIGLGGTLPHVNRSVREKEYRSYYNEVTKQALYQRFNRDFEYFKYGF